MTGGTIKPITGIRFSATCPSCETPGVRRATGNPNLLIPGSVCPVCGHVEPEEEA